MPLCLDPWCASVGNTSFWRPPPVDCSPGADPMVEISSCTFLSSSSSYTFLSFLQLFCPLVPCWFFLFHWQLELTLCGKLLWVQSYLVIIVVYSWRTARKFVSRLLVRLHDVRLALWPNTHFYGFLFFNKCLLSKKRADWCHLGILQNKERIFPRFHVVHSEVEEKRAGILSRLTAAKGQTKQSLVLRVQDNQNGQLASGDLFKRTEIMSSTRNFQTWCIGDILSP